MDEWIDVSKIHLNEVTMTSLTAGLYNGPVELGIKKWTNSELGPYKNSSKHPSNNIQKNKGIKNNVSKVVGGWEPRNGKFDVPTNYVSAKKQKRVKPNGEITSNHMDWFKNFDKTPFTKKVEKKSITEDLGVWFGTKKKPKGSSQPKGPWVNICRRDKDGKHPPCGRPDTNKGAYPKCRAAGVAGKMSDSQKKAACQQKRTAEKKDPQTGKGQKPVMTSYKPKKKKTLEESLTKIINRVLNSL